MSAKHDLETVTVTCWSCAGPVSPEAPFCHTCGTIQPPRAVDHFGRLGLRPGFEVDSGDLERRYFSFQRSFHPDRFAGKSQKEKAYSLQHTVGVNEAYKTLKAPLARAEYLLQLEGRGITEGGCATIDDPGLLIEAMEMREELDDAEDLAAVDAVLETVLTELKGCLRDLGAAFAAGDLDAATRLTTRGKYLDKLREEARRRRFRLADS